MRKLNLFRIVLTSKIKTIRS